MSRSLRPRARRADAGRARRAGRFSLIALSMGALLIVACARPGPSRDADASAFSREGLAAATAMLQDAVDRGLAGGIVTLIDHRGEVVQVDALGWQDPEARVPMARDSIFRIASMTKPITAVATLILLDEGRFSLDDPVDRWLPELANPTVLRHPSDPLDSAVPSPRAIRVVDLLTHRSGIVTPRDPPGPLRDALTEADAKNAAGYDQWMEWIGALPLAHVPGSTYSYGNSFDVLGIFIERVSGMPYPDFVRERIFEPLGMTDTAFRIPPEKRDRAARLQSLNGVPTSWIPSDETVPPYVAGAGGLYSTVDDYLKFARMLLRGGALGDVRILEPETVRAMKVDRLTDPQREGRPFGGPAGYWDGQGFGLGVAIKTEPDVRATEVGVASVGSFGWPGIFGTWWTADPVEELILILMVPGGDTRPLRFDWQEAVYEALVD